MKIKTDRISGISAFITPKMREHAVPGMAAALISGGEIIHTETAGCADPDKGIRITEDTHFEAASLTKPVFGRLVLKLASEGKLSLADIGMVYFPRRILRRSPFLRGHRKACAFTFHRSSQLGRMPASA